MRIGLGHLTSPPPDKDYQDLSSDIFMLLLVGLVERDGRRGWAGRGGNVPIAPHSLVSVAVIGKNVELQKCRIDIFSFFCDDFCDFYKT